MIICLCEGVSEHTVQRSINAGAKSVEAVGRTCGAGTGCGSCHCQIEELLASARGRQGEPDEAGPSLVWREALAASGS